MNTKNSIEADRAQKALDAFPSRRARDTHLVVTDLLTAVRHLCDRWHLSYGDLDSMAHENYLQELHANRDPNSPNLLDAAEAVATAHPADNGRTMTNLRKAIKKARK